MLVILDYFEVQITVVFNICRLGNISEPQALGGELLSHNTYANIVKNKANVDYCVGQFQFVESRISCIKLLTGRGPFLA